MPFCGPQKKFFSVFFCHPLRYAVLDRYISSLSKLGYRGSWGWGGSCGLNIPSLLQGFFFFSLCSFWVNWTKRRATQKLSRSLLLCERLSWGFFKCDRCEHRAEQYSLLHPQVREMCQRASNSAITGQGFLKVWCKWSLHAKLEKCHGAVWGPPARASLSVHGTPFNMRKYLFCRSEHFSSAKNSQTAQWARETISADQHLHPWYQWDLKIDTRSRSIVTMHYCSIRNMVNYQSEISRVCWNI